MQIQSLNVLINWKLGILLFSKVGLGNILDFMDKICYENVKPGCSEELETQIVIIIIKDF